MYEYSLYDNYCIATLHETFTLIVFIVFSSGWMNNVTDYIW